MATYYIDPVGGSAGNDGLSPSTPKAAPPAAANGIVWLFKRGTTYSSSSQWNWGTATNCTLSDYGDRSLPLPVINITAASTNAINIQGDGTHNISYIRFTGSTNVNGGLVGSGLVAATSKGANLVVDYCEFVNITENALRLGATGSQAALTFVCTNCTFRNIGQDAIYGGAIDYEVGYCHMENLSTNGSNGDGIGFIDADPTRVYIHHNTIDHSSTDYKHCIIIDSSTGAGSGVTIEFNTFYGYGNTSTAATTHTMVNGDCPMTVRSNTFYCAGIAANLAGAASVFEGNLVYVYNGSTGRPVVALAADNCDVYNNTFIGTGSLPSDNQCVVQANLTTGQEVRGNIFLNMVSCVVSSAATNPTCSNNNFWGITSKYKDNGGSAFSGSNDIDDDPRLDPRGRPTNVRLFTGGYQMNGQDLYGFSFPSNPSIGAIQCIGTYPRANLTTYQAKGAREGFMGRR